jgi:hypothetical protein
MSPNRREYKLDQGPVSDQTLETIRTLVDQQNLVPSKSLLGQFETGPEAGNKMADLLVLPNSEDVELDIDRARELPRSADFSDG